MGARLFALSATWLVVLAGAWLFSSRAVVAAPAAGPPPSTQTHLSFRPDQRDSSMSGRYPARLGAGAPEASADLHSQFRPLRGEAKPSYEELHGQPAPPPVMWAPVAPYPAYPLPPPPRPFGRRRAFW